MEITEKPTEQTPTVTADMDFYSDPVMSSDLYNVTASPQMIVYETSTQVHH